jgi:hypothetical protein
MASDVFPAIPPLELVGLLSALQPRVLQPFAPEALQGCSTWISCGQLHQISSPVSEELYELTENLGLDARSEEADRPPKTLSTGIASVVRLNSDKAVDAHEEQPPSQDAQAVMPSSDAADTSESSVARKITSEDMDMLSSACNKLKTEFDVQLLVWVDGARLRLNADAEILKSQATIRKSVEEAFEFFATDGASAPEMISKAIEAGARKLAFVLQVDGDAGHLLTKANREAISAVIDAAHSITGVPKMQSPVAIFGSTRRATSSSPSRRHATSSPASSLKISSTRQDGALEPPALQRAMTATGGPQEVCERATKAKCDKCDGPHETDACPHFKKVREKHKDAWANYGKRRSSAQLGGNGGHFVLHGGRCVPQPGDGSCLFHSLCFGLNGLNGDRGYYAQQLRRELASFIERNPTLEIAGDTIEEWVNWDANCSVSGYARRMAVTGWGGGIEMAACSLLKKVNVHVYEKRWLGGYKRISCFDCVEPTSKTIHVVYQGGMHYDALVPP